MKARIREYQGSDRTAFVKLMEQLMDYIVSIDDLKRTRRMPDFGESYTQRTLQKVAENNGIIYVAELDSELVGVVVGTIPEQTKEDQLEHVPSKFGEVLEIVVKAGTRGRGVGTMLMNKLEEYFKENNCDISGVGVLVPNKNAHRLYSKLGYEDRSFYMTKNLQEQK
ncbi:MAG: GNAT family N-acetyltransferase [Candidatus Bathyarchaeota archaeon]|jgi:ribosomal protein S18 acetylase RimI-like enzyme|nr:GNAT family N-acetyltransferase [Candidatus Bathyarchaeota archaeon]